MTSDEYSILLAPSAWSQLGRVDSTAYEAVSRALSQLALRPPAEDLGERVVGDFVIAFEVDRAGRRLIVRSVLPQP